MHTFFIKLRKGSETMDKLEQARITINEIDQEIAKLFEKRMQAVEQVALYKKEHQMEIFDPKREEELLNKNCAYIQNEQYLPYYRTFQQHMKDVSKSDQKDLLK